MAILDVVGLKKQYGENNIILENVTFQIQARQRIGLIGANGAGKSTLFRVLTGEEKCDEGVVQYTNDTKIGYLEQHTCRHPTRSAYDEVLTVFSPLLEMEKQLELLQQQITDADKSIEELVQKQFRIQEAYERDGGFLFRSRVRGALLGMGFTEDEFSLPVSKMSGGQKTRVALVKLLLSDANLLLLDEPTNHLDLESCRWLEDYLQGYKGAVLLISHDRYLLDRVTTITIEIEHKHAIVYPANYTRAMSLKEERRVSEAKHNEVLAREVKRMEESITQFRQWNREKSVKRARNMEKAVERLKSELVEEKKSAQTFTMDFEVSRTSGNDVLYIENMSKGYGPKPLFADFNLLLKRHERLFLLGPNGCGKTTLFRILTEEETADTGLFRWGSNVSVGYYQQSLLFKDGDKTVFDEVHDAYPSMTNTEVRNALGRFLFRGDDVFKRLDALSGGEKARVHLLKLMLAQPNLLLLDEPTNHLDIASKEVIESALDDYAGTLFVISHDRYFINRLADRVLYMESGNVTAYQGNYDYFLEQRAKKDEAVVQKKPVESGTTAASYKAQKEAKAIYRKCVSDIAKTEDKIATLEDEIEQIKKETQNPNIAADYTKLIELTEKLDAKTEELDELYVLWEELQTTLANCEAE